VEVEVDDRYAKTPLLWVLRDVLGMRGTKYGCGAGLCAASTVLIDGRSMKACRTWYRGNVVQCGYCQPGQTLAAISLLTSNPEPDDAAIDTWMSGNLCRCDTYPRIRAAIHDAAANAEFDSVRVVNDANGGGPPRDVYGNPESGDPPREATAAIAGIRRCRLTTAALTLITRVAYQECI
jgi:isoquinoline 1-oxidoreductase subunit alpha